MFKEENPLLAGGARILFHKTGRISMHWTKRHTSGQRIHFIYVFLFGFFIGVFLVNMWKDVFINSTGFFDEEMLYEMKYTRINIEKFFVYALKQRLTLFTLLAIGATTYFGIAMVYGAYAWFGFIGGIFMASVAVRYGFKGILLMAGVLLPHFLIYIPAFRILLNWCYNICCSMYFPAKLQERPEVQYRSKKRFVLVQCGRLFCILLVVIIGILVESYVNPILLAKILKNF